MTTPTGSASASATYLPAQVQRLEDIAEGLTEILPQVKDKCTEIEQTSGRPAMMAAEKLKALIDDARAKIAETLERAASATEEEIHQAAEELEKVIDAIEKPYRNMKLLTSPGWQEFVRARLDAGP